MKPSGRGKDVVSKWGYGTKPVDAVMLCCEVERRLFVVGLTKGSSNAQLREWAASSLASTLRWVRTAHLSPHVPLHLASSFRASRLSTCYTLINLLAQLNSPRDFKLHVDGVYMRSVCVGLLFVNRLFCLRQDQGVGPCTVGKVCASEHRWYDDGPSNLHPHIGSSVNI
jgi:hypothetical protein